MNTLARVIFVLVSISAVLGGASPAAEPLKPNIVFIFADDWGWGDLSCHGHPWLETPNIDRLAREGIDFEQFNVLNPVCSPSRAAAMTGRYPARFCIHEHFAPGINVKRGMPDWLDPRATNIARLLKGAGYRTGHFGKWHLTNTGVRGAPPLSAYGFDETAFFNGPSEAKLQAKLDAAAGDAVRFIRENAGQPFFVNVWIHETHTPHVPSAAAMEKWKHLDEQRQVYAAVVTDGDNAVGRILEALRDTGVEDDTLVIFSSDNGPEWTSRRKAVQTDATVNARGYDAFYSVGDTGGLRGRKRSLFEGGVRVPFIVRWPGRAPAGVRNDTTVITAVDLLPTLCAAATIELPAGYQGDGESLLPAFAGKPVSRTRPIFWEWRGTAKEPDWWPRLAVREGDWKLLLTNDAARVELHNLSDDRSEQRDVARAHPEVVERLARMAIDWKATLPEKPDPACISPELSPVP